MRFIFIKLTGHYQFQLGIIQLLHRFQQEIQALEQRITDLELLVGQPTGSVQFTEPPAQPVWDNYNPPAADDGVRWYQP